MLSTLVGNFHQKHFVWALMCPGRRGHTTSSNFNKAKRPDGSNTSSGISDFFPIFSQLYFWPISHDTSASANNRHLRQDRKSPNIAGELTPSTSISSAQGRTELLLPKLLKLTHIAWGRGLNLKRRRNSASKVRTVAMYFHSNVPAGHEIWSTGLLCRSLRKTKRKQMLRHVSQAVRPGFVLAL